MVRVVIVWMVKLWYVVVLFSSFLSPIYLLTHSQQIPTRRKDLGRCEIFPQFLKHNNKGNFVAMVGDGEYIIYTSRQLRQKAFGSGLNFCWSSSGSGDYAVRVSSSRVNTFKNFKDHKQIRVSGIATNIWGGPMLTVASSDCVWFYDWDTCTMVRQIDVEAKQVFWSDSGDRVAICSNDGFYVLSVDRDVVESAIEEDKVDDEDGVNAFDLIHEFNDVVTSGVWVCIFFLSLSLSSLCGHSVTTHTTTTTTTNHRSETALFTLSTENYSTVLEDNPSTSHISIVPCMFLDTLRLKIACFSQTRNFESLATNFYSAF